MKKQYKPTQQLSNDKSFLQIDICQCYKLLNIVSGINFKITVFIPQLVHFKN